MPDLRADAPAGVMEQDKELESGRLASNTPDSSDATVVNLSLRNVEPVDIRVRDLGVSIDISPSGFTALKDRLGRYGGQSKRYKDILKDVGANMLNGSLTAIIGGSGSGKTSMLNALSHRLRGARLETNGTVLYNGNSKLSSIRSAYVMQQDVLLPTLTVRETLCYAAELRLPPPTTVAERRQVVEDVILELGLKECANTRIGNNIHKGCSGGEKRRTSLGVQLLSNPSVLFLDEVTTGLDATSAFQLIRTLKMLSSKGRTIIVTIHQPRSEIWGLFDNILLLSGGSPLYSGSAHECLGYFSDHGYNLPEFVNPAEFLIDLAAIDTRTEESEATSAARVLDLKQAWSQSSLEKLSKSYEDKRPYSGMPSMSTPNAREKHSTTVGRQIRVLTERTFKMTYRDPMGMAGSLLEAVTMGIINGLIFLQLDGSLAGIRSREGALYTAAALQGYLILLFETYRLTVDIELFDRERSEGVVSVSAFLISRRLARYLVEDIPVPFIFSVIFYFMVGFRAEVNQFFTFFAVSVLMQYIAVTFATTCVAVSRNFAGASLIANMGYTIQSLGCGYFVQSNQIPVYVRWLKWTAYVFYGFGALAANEFTAHTKDVAGRLYDCPTPGGAANPACEQYTGQFVMQSLGFPSNWVWRPILVLMGFVVFFYIVAGLILQFWTVEMSISKAQHNDGDFSAGKEDLETQSRHDIRTIDITLCNYSLDIHKRNIWQKKSTRISVLKSISTGFEPGLLNVIMGPSGSGKTSLLNLMARRLHSTLLTRYQITGDMLINGAVPSASVIGSICAYVCQDDDALLPYLTVRENLHFAAGLRLPSHLTKREKLQRAESVLLKMGLRDCADTLVGSELVKGISGGEKRRVTIAIQILTDPRVLLLDEPTSGLDAFTASSIMDVLRGLAQEGRTLILTIHQSRSDLFRHFGHVLLLARGGFPVYAGPGSRMLEHFASLGHSCPPATNPADFALDLITVDLQQSHREEASREKVRSLITSWTDSSAPVRRTTSRIATPAELGSFARSMTPFRIAFPLLLHRSFINFRRNPPSIIARTTQVLGFGVILTLFFAPLKSDYISIQTRLGFIQEMAALYFVGMLQNVAVYPDEKAVFYREHDDGAYPVSAFFLQYTLAEIPFEVVTSLIFAVLTVLAAGLPRSVSVFFIVAFNCFSIVSCGESIGIMFNTLVTHTGFAVNLTSVILSIATIMGGIMALDIPSFLQAFNHLSPIKWALGNLAMYTLSGIKFSCPDEQKLPNGQCPISTGEEVLSLYNLETNAGLNLMALGICVVVYRVLAYVLLVVRRTRWDWKGFWEKHNSPYREVSEVST